TLYLKQKGGVKYLLTLIPCVIMLVITIWAMLHNLIDFASASNHLLLAIGSVVFVLAVWMVIETIIIFLASNGEKNA
ncbi:MAG: carbon starvation protein A, partial [Phycisphaerae bacterium]|nr:carbon starvation protein A [Phycisphaerae bacterium]